MSEKTAGEPVPAPQRWNRGVPRDIIEDFYEEDGPLPGEVPLPLEFETRGGDGPDDWKIAPGTGDEASG